MDISQLKNDQKKKNKKNHKENFSQIIMTIGRIKIILNHNSNIGVE